MVKIAWVGHAVEIGVGVKPLVGSQLLGRDVGRGC